MSNEIRNWSDVEVFKGKIVLFMTNNYYFRGNRQMTPQYAMIAPSPSIWTDGDMGYNMSIFKKKSEVASNNALINAFLKQGTMTMRLATETELKMLIPKLNTDQYGFEYKDNKYAIQKIESQLA